MQKPADLQYGLTDKPPFLRLLLLGLQQVFLLASYFAIVLIVYRAAHLPPLTISHAISLSMIALAISTLLQVMWKGPIGSGYLVLPVISAIYLAASLLAVKAAGIPGLITMTVFAGIFEFVFSFFIQYLRFIFTAAVTGLVILLVGFELSILGLTGVLNLDHSEVLLHPGLHILAAVVTIGLMISISVWARGFLRLFPVIVGLVIGAILSWILGILSPESLGLLHQAPVLALPILPTFSFHFLNHLLVPFAFAAIAAGLRAMGSIITAQTINDTTWTHTDFVSVRKGIAADGLGNVVAGLLGVPGISAAPTSVAISKVSGATSRYISFSAAAWLIVLAFFPLVSMVFLLIPMSVIGAALLYNGSFMMLAGIRLMTSRTLDTRNILVVGISFILGASRIVFPDFYNHLPLAIAFFTNSALSIAALSAIVLTLFFRIGIHNRIKIIKDEKVATLTDFHHTVRAQLKKLNVPAAIADNALLATETFLEELRAAEIDLSKGHFEVDFDEVTLTLSFTYPGPTIGFSGAEKTNRHYMLEDQAATDGLAKMYAGGHIDDITTTSANGMTQVKLSFFL